MAGFWKTKVLPKIKKVFDKSSPKKAAAAEACKAFDDSKEEINKEFEEKKTELQPKVIEIYEATAAEVKTLVKEPKEESLKKHSAAVHKFLEELVKIEFPGSKTVCDASTKYGAAFVPGPVFFIFEKVSSFIVVEERPKEAEAAATEETKKAEETSGEKEKEIVATEEKKEEATSEEKKEEPKPEEKKEEPKAEEKKEEPKTEEPKTEEKKEATTTEAPKA